MSQFFEKGKCRPMLAGVAPKAEQARQSLIYMTFSVMVRPVPPIHGVLHAGGPIGITATFYSTPKAIRFMRALFRLRG
jgi:hypothetical protein